jgi:vacuolar protein sorting-associated protein 13A/C
MSLLRMDKPSDGVRFLDDLDLTLSMDNRRWTAQQMSSIELTLQPVVFRVSYRDINLITAIVNKAIELSTKSHSRTLSGAQGPTGSLASRGDMTSRQVSSRTGSGVASSARVSLDMPQVFTTREQVCIPYYPVVTSALI